jgi:hypothetical protein
MSSFPTTSGPSSLQGAWEKLGSQKLTSAASSITFSGLSTDYRLWRVAAYVVKDGTGGTLHLRLNNDSGTNYAHQYISVDSTVFTGGRVTGQSSMLFGGNTAIGANEHRQVSCLIGKQQTGSGAMMVTPPSAAKATNIEVDFVANVWNNTADLVSRIDVLVFAGNLAAGTAVTLEGNRTS